MDFTPGKHPLGVVDPCEYQQFNMKLEIGDMVLSFSNALTECRAATGGTIGLDGLLNRVRQLDPSRPSELVAQLVTLLQREHIDNLVMNDSTVLLCRVADTGVRWQDNVLAPLRLLRPVTDKTRIG